MKNTNKFEGATKTVTNVPVKNVRFNTAVNLYLGMVYDEQSYRSDKWTSASWKPNGKCVNRNRPELDLSELPFNVAELQKVKA